MSNGNGLPKGWASARLDEVADISSNRKVADLLPETPVNFVPMAAVREEFGGIDVSALRPYSEVQKGYTQFREGDVLLAKITPCMENGKVAVVPRLDNECGYGSTEFHVLRPQSCIAPDWIAHYVSQKGFRREAQRNMTGSAGQLRVPKHWLQEQYIPVAPSGEQRRIVAKIEELFSDLDAGVAALERVKAKLKRYRAAVLKAAVEGKLTEAWRKKNRPKETGQQLLDRILQERRCRWEEEQLAAYEQAGKKLPVGWKAKYKEPAGPDESSLPELPEGWCWASVAQCASREDYAITDGPFGSNLKTEHYTDDGPRVIRLQNIGDGNFVEEDAHISFHHFTALQRHAVKHADVVIAMLGEMLPRACLVPLHIPPAIVKADCVKVTANRSLALPSFLVVALNSHPTRIRASAQIAGVGRPRLNLEKLRPLAIPLPPLSEQQQIIAEVDQRLSILQAADLQINANLKRSARLRQSILKRAFEGKLVSQDPNDEPASVLLERIKATRENGSPKQIKPARKTK
jgi:type I restriction enzyme S subunit